MSVGRYITTRLSVGAVQVLVVAVVVFVLAAALPGDAAVALTADDPDPARVDALRVRFGLDRPFHERLLGMISGLLTGDLVTFVSGRPVVETIADSFGPTLTLAVLALAIVVPAAVGIGVLAAVRRGSWIDRAISGTAVAFYAVPEFAVAVLLVAVVSVWLGVLPATAIGAGKDLLSSPQVWILPVLVLALRPVCSLSRLVRVGVTEALDSGFVSHLTALGVSFRRVLWRYVVPGALPPAIQHLARTVDWLLGGVVVIEAVFAVSGVGQLMVSAITSRDLPLITGLVVVFATITVTANTVADVAARMLTPERRTVT